MQCSALTPLIFLLHVIVGGVGTALLVVYEQYNYIWMVWAIPNSTLHPLFWGFYVMRMRKLRRAMGEWNRYY